MHEQSISGKSVAILCRTNAEVSVVKETITSLNIPVQGKADNFAEMEGILRSIMSSEYCVNWLASMLPNEDYARYLRLSVLSDSTMDEIKFINLFGNKFSMIVEKIFNCRRILSNNVDFSIRFRELINFLKLPFTDKFFDIQTLDEGVNILIDMINEVMFS